MSKWGPNPIGNSSLLWVCVWTRRPMQCTCMEVDTTTDKRGGFKGALHPCSWGIMYRSR